MQRNLTSVPGVSLAPINTVLRTGRLITSRNMANYLKMMLLAVIGQPCGISFLSYSPTGSPGHPSKSEKS
jgi:hypothetical protein